MMEDDQSTHGICISDKIRAWPEPPLFKFLVITLYIISFISNDIIFKVLGNNRSDFFILDAKVFNGYYHSFVSSGGSVESALRINICVNVTMLICLGYVLTRVVYELISGKTRSGQDFYVLKVVLVFFISICIFSTMQFSTSSTLLGLSVKRPVIVSACEISFYIDSLTIMASEVICQILVLAQKKS